MALLCIVPKGITLENLPRVQKGLLKAQKTIVDKIPSGLKKHKKFEYFSDIASKAPFLVLDRSRSDERNWHQSNVDVEKALDSILPTTVYEQLKQNNKDLPAIQEVMKGSAKIHSFGDFVYINESGDKCTSEFAILRIADIDKCKLEVYFVKLTASFHSYGALGMYKTSHNMSVQYCFNEYSVLTDVLLSVELDDSERDKQAMKEWFEMTAKS